MKLFTDDDFPARADGCEVYLRTATLPICTCSDPIMAAEIAKRLNRDNCEWPEDPTREAP